MKLILSAITAFFFLPGCRKTDLDVALTHHSLQNVAPVDTACDDILTCMVPSAAEFPGGRAAWAQFLQKNLVYPVEAADKDIQGTVIVEFIVNADGALSDIIAISGPDELKQSATKVVQKSPKWIPSQSNGRLYKDYRRQSIMFRIEE